MDYIQAKELDPIHDNIIRTIEFDPVGRNKTLWQFACFCSAQREKCSIALDGGWGTGKTFFLKQLEMLFDAFSNHPKQLKPQEQKIIKQCFKGFNNELNCSIQPHCCVYYDAWLNDNSDDPLRSILYELVKQAKHKFVKKSKMEYLRTACSIFDAFTGKNTSSLVDLANNTNPVHELEAQKSFYDTFSKFLNSFLPQGKGRLLVLIDELDRCKPSYAVQLLERIKHYLSNKRVSFVFAINNEQLQHTIKAFYGDGFDAYQYLNRFFNYRLSLPPPDIDYLNKYYGFDQSEKDFDSRLYMEVCNAFIQEHSLSFRDATRYQQWVKIVCESFKKHGSNSDSISWKFVIYIVVPIVLGLRTTNKQLFDDFMNGKDPSPLLEILRICPIANRFLEYPDKALVEEKFDFDNVFWDIMPSVESIYNKLFKYKNDVDEREIYTPLLYDTKPFEFTKEMSDTIFSASNFMADFIKFDTNTEEPAHG